MAVLHVKEQSLALALVQCVRRPLALQFEHNDTVVVSGGKHVLLRMRGHDPEAIVVATKGGQAGALGHVPDTNGFVL